MKHLLQCLLVAALSLSAGCGTMAGRGGTAEPMPVETYKSVNGDLHLLGLRPGPSGSGNAGPVMCLISIVCPLLVVVSLPVDAVIDTLLLPADLLAARE
ncbi:MULTISPECIES: YceK/YidQ family lipoprotein [Pseudomonadaceae]|uniref:YceK/YidQ family lipoprotein n=2 Tax=Ectopseudomonas TaxID=3236654 RepID=A4XP36_ECTM1|nr:MULTISPECIES: YceK/YidQ family lipoprotein [Pseudomonas]ATH84075.1 YceK/YidQ family lipoprotein [Pseudomonas mendocina]MBF8160183.1 YceK/YidQ family lipoprotein [Pseudomonas mendocina]MDH0098669.1 YceK/YidQ family lipoprotein [Pseudomonas sp. GD04158]USR40220.1 YceK/YidQ family lipoprotein [Pseudomonas hydrolytica]UTH32048.1 YceK/YidQ family lipoprotein [Pseudomonas hydrolytica]